jgi:uncharacterized protein
MRLAVNYSHSAASLVQTGQIAIDYFKTPDWEWMVSEAAQLKPIAVHFNLEAGNDNLGQVDWDKVIRLAQITQTPFINLHLDSRQSYYPDYAADTCIESEVEQVYKIILADVMGVVRRFGAKRVIIENSPYRAEEGNTMCLCIQPGLITRLVRETGCGLLLDISHAIITARTLEMRPDEYIAKLPMENMREMHFAGVQKNLINGQWMDHLAIQETDWKWLDWVLARIHVGEWNNPWLLAFEYGGVGEPFEWRSNPEVILQQVPQLQEHIKLLTE